MGQIQVSLPSEGIFFLCKIFFAHEFFYCVAAFAGKVYLSIFGYASCRHQLMPL
jgi:hypothetical protein